jgi:hypothetical protein
MFTYIHEEGRAILRRRLPPPSPSYTLLAPTLAPTLLPDELTARPPLAPTLAPLASPLSPHSPHSPRRAVHSTLGFSGRVGLAQE